MTVQKLKQELGKLKEFLQEKKETPWDCKCLMMQFKDEMLRREIVQKIYEVSGKTLEASGPIELYYSNFSNLSWQAREFLAMTDAEKTTAIEREFPPNQYSEPEVKDLRKRLVAKINGRNWACL